MSIIWIDIWDAQSDIKAKGLINRYFNVGSYIATICGVNMNLGVLQCKNCWKWDHTTGACRIQGPDIQSVAALINPFTTRNLPGVIRLTRKLILLDLR